MYHICRDLCFLHKDPILCSWGGYWWKVRACVSVLCGRGLLCVSEVNAWLGSGIGWCPHCRPSVESTEERAVAWLGGKASRNQSQSYPPVCFLGKGKVLICWCVCGFTPPDLFLSHKLLLPRSFRRGCWVFLGFQVFLPGRNVAASHIFAVSPIVCCGQWVIA